MSVRRAAFFVLAQVVALGFLQTGNCATYIYAPPVNGVQTAQGAPYTPPNGVTLPQAWPGGMAANFVDTTALGANQPVPGSTYVAGVWTAPVVPPPPVQTTIGAGPFLDRFTSAEYAAILTAVKSNATADAWYNRYILAAGQITVTDPNIINGMNALVTAGLLTSARATQILNLAAASP